MRTRPIQSAIACMILCIIATAVHSPAVTVNINEQTEYQTIIGFGGNDPGSDAATLVNDLGLSAHRSDMLGNGSSGPSWSALKQLSDLGVKTFIACPWSPPGNLKYVNSESSSDVKWNRVSNGLGPMNDFRHPTVDPEKGGMGNMYPAWATFMANWVKNFKSNVGIDLFAVCPQNEPAFAQSFPSCVFNAYQLRDAVEYLGDTLKARGYTATKIAAGDGMLSTFGGDNFGGAIAGFSDNYIGAAKYVDFINVHGYGSNGATPTPSNQVAMAWSSMASFCSGTHARNIAKKKFGAWMTETSGYQDWLGGSSPDDGSAQPGSWALGLDMYSALKYGKISAWFWWRLSVTADYWRDEALMLNHQKLKTYFVSKQYYRYVRPGAVHIKCDPVGDSTILVIAFNDKVTKNLVIVALNTGTSSKSITPAGSNMPASYKAYRTSSNEDCIDVSASAVAGQNITLPAQSITTIVGTGYTPPAVAIGSRTIGAGIRNIGNTCTMTIYDISGRMIRRVDRVPAAAMGQVSIAGHAGRTLPRGSYYAVITDDAGAVVISRSTIRIR